MARYSAIHLLISQYGYEKMFKKYKSMKSRDFERCFGVCHKTALDIFGPKMTRSKKVMVGILKKEGDNRKISEIANSYIL